MQRLEGIQNGLRLSVTTPLEEVEAAAASEDTLVLEFDAFRDGVHPDARSSILGSMSTERAS